METILDPTRNYIVLDAADLKTFAIQAGMYTAYAGVFVWGTRTVWKRDIKPMLEDRKARKLRQKLARMQAAAKR